jgi:hypothetical protein
MTGGSSNRTGCAEYFADRVVSSWEVPAQGLNSSQWISWHTFATRDASRGVGSAEMEVLKKLFCI